ncbi:SDR family NAD(P)-dependent oxidoreductase [Bradyrhizobium liaoningense]|uniref:SDR family NAD(P)-dependent oxidoreductase n=1 Tax=Bradyrhizobium liaoningense TaxID=43992 RepID=UPI001BA95CF8|nr:SDR family oxidoreductase [Bradyrhizobium liaoningense]MBR0856999.1 SDR family oxidoreductase [Bradyrhizobium liaoningense]
MTTAGAAATGALPNLLPRAGSRVAVAGGCGELGKSLVRASLAANLQVVIFDRPALLQAGSIPNGAKAIGVEATDGASITEAFAGLAQTHGDLDHLFFVIGFSPTPPRPLRDSDIDQWDSVMSVNLRSAFLFARVALPLLRKRPQSSVTFVSSALTYGIQSGYGPYIAAKSGLNGLVRALAIENAPHVRVNAVAPSVMLTPFLGGGTGQGGEHRERSDWFDATAAASVVPMQRLCTPGDVVGPMLFLASDAARFITGQILHVNGGRLTA